MMKCVSVLVILISLLFGHSRAATTIEFVFDDTGCRTPNLGIGDCIPLEQCDSILNYIDTHEITDNASKLIKKYLCGYDKAEKHKVCCPRKSGEVEEILSRFSGGFSGKPSAHPNRKLLPTECGRAASINRITNGNVTDLFEFPWAAVFKYDTTETNPWKCGGSLINDRYVLTAAHCVRSRFKLLQVRLGEYDFANETDCVEYGEDEVLCAPAVQDFDISSEDTIVHPQYDSRTQANDIALVRLRKAADLTVDSVGPVCLPITEGQRTHPYENYTVIGWGTTETEFPSSVLLKVLVPVQQNSKCASLYGKIPVTAKHICAGGKKQQDSCTGDSGGPLSGDFTNERKQVEAVQYGIVSLGATICGRVGFPSLYTRVIDYVGWILDTIKP